MNNLDKSYLDLCQEILDKGNRKVGRNGATISVFGKQIRHKMSNGFPLLTTKKMHFKGIVTELLWFLRGDTNIKYLLENDCNIWIGDALQVYQKYESKEIKKLLKEDPYTLVDYQRTTKEEFINKIKTDDEFAKKWGDLGPIYGKQWRNWTNFTGDEIAPNGWEMANNPIDQFSDLIRKLKTTPDDRRMMVTAWNPSEIEAAVLPPCHYGFQVYTRELSELERWGLYCETCNRLQTPSIKGSTDRETMDRYYTEYNIPTRAISLSWNQRSVDTPLGLPYNIASYGLLLTILGKLVNMVPEELIGNLGDTHIYENQIEKLKEQFGEELTLEEKRNWLNKNYPMHEVGEWTIEQLSDDVYLKEVETEYSVPKRSREPFPLPSVSFSDNFETLVRKFNGSNEGLGAPDYVYFNNIDNVINALTPSDFQLTNYQSHSKIEIPLSN